MNLEKLMSNPQLMQKLAEKLKGISSAGAVLQAVMNDQPVSDSDVNLVKGVCGTSGSAEPEVPEDAPSPQSDLVQFSSPDAPAAGTRTVVEMIGPERAAKDLERAKGKNYRKLSESWVKSLAKDWRNGRFEFNHKPIEYDEEGILHDGQHRLKAVVLTGLTLPFVVVYGSKPTKSEGSVKRRSAADHLRQLGHVNMNELSATLKLLCLWMSKGLNDKSGGHGDIVSANEIVAAVDLFPGLDWYVALARRGDAIKNRPGRGYSSATLAAVMYISCELLAQKCPRYKATAFIEGLLSGVNLSEDDPVYQLREAFRQDKMVDRRNRLPLVVKAWNAFKFDKSMKRLTWKYEDPIPEIL